MNNKLTYTNRKGHMYYFREVNGKRGMRIACSTKESNDDLAAIPDTHEIAETPNGQVSCRTKIDRKVLPDEIEYAENICPGIVDPHFRIAIEEKKKEIIIHSADTQSMNEIAKFVIKFCADPAGIKAITEGNLRYEPVLKLELVDPVKRQFSIFRMCWAGGSSEWLYLKDGNLPALLEEYVPHIGQESFYELF